MPSLPTVPDRCGSDGLVTNISTAIWLQHRSSKSEWPKSTRPVGFFLLIEDRGVDPPVHQILQSKGSPNDTPIIPRMRSPLGILASQWLARLLVPAAQDLADRSAVRILRHPSADLPWPRTPARIRTRRPQCTGGPLPPSTRGATIAIFRYTSARGPRLLGETGIAGKGTPAGGMVVRPGIANASGRARLAENL